LLPLLLIAVSIAAWAQTPAQLAAAESQYEAQIKQKPTAGNWQRLGLARYMQSKYREAIAPLREAVRLDPKLWTADLFLGISLYRTNQFGPALTALERAAHIAPMNGQGRDDVDYWMGATKIALRQPLAGLGALERLLARNPNHLEALELAAQTYADLSSQFWNDVAERHFETPAGYEIHGHALEAEGNLPDAINAYRQSKMLDPKRAGPGAAIGRLLLRQSKPQEALTVLEKEFGSEAAYYRGLALLALERGQEAVPFLAEAATAATTDPEPAVALAQVYLALGDKEKAAGAARRALTIAPDSAAARELLESSRGR
jgi:tetratricopeptide (TPR) repeat protein